MECSASGGESSDSKGDDETSNKNIQNRSAKVGYYLLSKINIYCMNNMNISVVRTKTSFAYVASYTGHNALQFSSLECVEYGLLYMSSLFQLYAGDFVELDIFMSLLEDLEASRN